MKTIIGILTKSPHPKGRIGKVESQDWYIQCKQAALLHGKISNSQIVITSALQVKDALPEEKYYTDVLNHLGPNYISLGKGVETIEQLRIFKEYIEKNNSVLILLVTWTHFLRVKWLVYRVNLPICKYIISWGIPRPKELITDIILTFVYPIIDLIGKGEWFRRRVVDRREGGKF